MNNLELKSSLRQNNSNKNQLKKQNFKKSKVHPVCLRKYLGETEKFVYTINFLCKASF